MQGPLRPALRLEEMKLEGFFHLGSLPGSFSFELCIRSESRDHYPSYNGGSLMFTPVPGSDIRQNIWEDAMLTCSEFFLGSNVVLLSHGFTHRIQVSFPGLGTTHFPDTPGMTYYDFLDPVKAMGILARFQDAVLTKLQQKATVKV